jgi:hypothetical protein
MLKESNNKSSHTTTDDQEPTPNVLEHNKLQTTEDCRDCDNVSCKCQLIMSKIDDIIELSTQIEHFELFNIMLTISSALKTLHDDETGLDKILSACEETYGNINPKEMHKILN